MSAKDLNEWASFLRGKYGILWPIETGTEAEDEEIE